MDRCADGPLCVPNLSWLQLDISYFVWVLLVVHIELFIGNSSFGFRALSWEIFYLFIYFYFLFFMNE